MHPPPDADAGPARRTPARRSWPRRATLFAANGYAGTSVRAVAAAAGVDAALVHHYFGTKDDLFLAALQAPVDPREVLLPVAEGGIDGAGERLLRMFLSVWDDEATRLPLLTLVRSVFDPGAAAARRATASCGWCWARSGGPSASTTPERRMSLVASQLIGHRDGALRRSRSSRWRRRPHDQLVAAYAPTLQRYLGPNAALACSSPYVCYMFAERRRGVDQHAHNSSYGE